MTHEKPHLEFFRIDMGQGWERPAGYKAGFWQKILASNLDEVSKTGSRSRLLRIEPGVFSEQPFIHDHWEEVYVVEGDLIAGSDKNGKGGEQFFAPAYACRPPSVAHGPFTSRNGCVLFELHYYNHQDKAGTIG